MITQKELKEIIEYEPDTGQFYWKRPAGHPDDKGRIRITIHEKMYSAARLAWLYMYGYTSEYSIMHINKNISDNKIKNLREATRSCYLRNHKLNKNNTSGVAGVSFYNSIQKWIACVRDEQKNRIRSKGFKNFDDAVKARWELEKQYNYPDCNSSSSAYKYLKKEGII